MGNGRKNNPDTPKPPPYAAHRALIADLGTPSAAMPGANDGTGGAALAVDFCEQTHHLEIELRAGAAMAVNEPVRLVLAAVPRAIAADGRDLGALSVPQTSAIRRCLIDGYDFVGSVTSIALDRGTAEISVNGVKLE